EINYEVAACHRGRSGSRLARVQVVAPVVGDRTESHRAQPVTPEVLSSRIPSSFTLLPAADRVCPNHLFVEHLQTKEARLADRPRPWVSVCAFPSDQGPGLWGGAPVSRPRGNATRGTQAFYC